jgi:hypothetical protein
MWPRSHFVLLVGLSLLVTRPGSGEPPAAREDRQRGGGDDSLPAGALVHLGDARFRAGGVVQVLAFSPDGKTLLSVDGCYEPGAAARPCLGLGSSEGTEAVCSDRERQSRWLPLLRLVTKHQGEQLDADGAEQSWAARQFSEAPHGQLQGGRQESAPGRQAFGWR